MVHSVLSAILENNGTQVDDESLRTCLCECEAIINSRPLTVNNFIDPDSLEPIAPSHGLFFPHPVCSWLAISTQESGGEGSSTWPMSCGVVGGKSSFWDSKSVSSGTMLEETWLLGTSWLWKRITYPEIAGTRFRYLPFQGWTCPLRTDCSWQSYPSIGWQEEGTSQTITLPSYQAIQKKHEDRGSDPWQGALKELYCS